MIYWDNSIKLGLCVKDKKIQYFVHKKPFNQECVDVEYGDKRVSYGQIGVAYHSGHRGIHIADYCGIQAIVDISKDNPVSIASNYSIADDEWIDIDEFMHKNMMSFYTNDTYLMPLLGYVVVKENIKEPVHSMYEVKNNTKKPISGKQVITCDDTLNGDNLGQMAMLIASGKRVWNNICTTPFKDWFYGKVLSKDIRHKTCTTALVRRKDIKPVKQCCYDIASKWRIEGKYLGLEEFKDINIHLVRDDEIAIINTIGYLSQFTNGQCNVIYSTNPFAGYDYEAVWSDVFN